MSHSAANEPDTVLDVGWVTCEGYRPNPTSPMGLRGYRVGKASSYSDVERRKILTEVFLTDSLKLEINDSDYVERWGTAGSPERLQSMARHLKLLLNLSGGRASGDWQQCNRDWSNDLAWLKKAHYRKRVHKFLWPELKTV